MKNSFKVLPFQLIVDSPSYLNTFKLSRGRPPRVPSWVPLVSASGDKFKVNPTDQVVLFIHWMNGSERVDLDLSVVMMSKGNEIGRVDYCCLELWNCRHSGDYTSAPPPNGASEFITFIPSEVAKEAPEIEEIFVMCFSFNKVDFDKMGQAFVGIGMINPDSPGRGPGGCNVISGCELRGSSEVNFTSKFSFVAHEFTFMNVNITSSQAYNSVRSNSKLICEVSQKYNDWESRRSPPSFLKVANTLCYASEEVKFVDGTEKKYFRRRNGETNLQFFERIQSGIMDEEPAENTKQILFIGDFHGLTNEVTKEWPKESLVVSKVDPKVENVIWSSDPYAAFMNENAKEERERKRKAKPKKENEIVSRRNPKKQGRKPRTHT